MGENCPTCLQKIEPETADKLAELNAFISSNLRGKAKQAAATWATEIGKIRSLSLDTAPYEATLKEIQSRSDELNDLFDVLLSDLKNRVAGLLSSPALFNEYPINLEAINRLDKYIEALQKKEAELTDDASIAKSISDKESRINEISDRITVLNSKEAILSEVASLKVLECFSSLKQNASTSRITRFISTLTASSSVGKIQQLFDSELKKLGFNHFNVQATTRASRGVQSYSLGIIAENTSLLDIASEGEQKCIALAGFFAELATDERRSAIVFDDPVNSLDHFWRQKFAQRILEESKERQVIVFTHDLPFMKLMQETASDKITIKALTRTRSASGIPASAPPWDAQRTRARIGTIKDNLVPLRKVYHTEPVEAYQKDASKLYGMMRETWERLVEELLMMGVVERFNREVKTQNCRYLVDINDDDIQRIDTAMKKCGTFFVGHDMATEMSGVFPSYEELSSDVNELDIYFKDLKKRRN